MFRSNLLTTHSSRIFKCFSSKSLTTSITINSFHTKLNVNQRSNSSDKVKTIIKAIKVPEMGEGINFATISRWKKHPGDECDGSDVLAELEIKNSDMKLILELRPPVKGQVKEHLKSVGDQVAIGERIAMMETTDIDEESRLKHLVEDALDDVHILPK